MHDIDKILPIASQPEKDLLFTDTHHGLTTTGTNKGGILPGTIGKQPWFSQKMNRYGRLQQLLISASVMLLGIGIGFVFLRMIPTPTNLRLLFKYGYHSPHQGVRIVDISLQPVYTAQTSTPIAHITLHNFTDSPRRGKPIKIQLKSSDQNTNEQIIDCCKGSIAPGKSMQISAKMEGSATSATTVSAQLVN